MVKKITFLGVLVVFFGCQTEKKCKLGVPKPIFSRDLQHVTMYDFQRQGQNSMESLLLDTGVSLEIDQSGCDDLVQEYRFTVKGDFSAFPDSLWPKEAVRQLVFLSTFSPKQQPLKLWADAIEEQRLQMRLGEDFELQAGIFVRVDRILSTGESTLLLRLSQK